MRLLKIALDSGRFDLAAHVLVYGLVMAHRRSYRKGNGHRKEPEEAKPEERSLLRPRS